MDEVSIVGVDLAKQVFQVHGAAKDGRVLFRTKLSRLQFPKFMEELPPCIVAMEACGTVHYWGRELSSFGHHVRLIPPIYVKAFVKRQKNDAADAEAVAEAAMRPTMRTVAVKTSEQQARAMVFRTRDLLGGQRTQMVNALRGHLAEHGIIVGRGLDKVDRLKALITSDNLPELVQSMARLYLCKIEQLHSEIDEIDHHIAAEARKSDVVRRLQKCQVAARYARWQSQPLHPQCKNSGLVAILLLGSVLFRGSTRPPLANHDLVDEIKAVIDRYADLRISQCSRDPRPQRLW